MRSAADLILNIHGALPWRTLMEMSLAIWSVEWPRSRG